MTLPAGALAAPHLRVFHDDDAEVYLNGVLVAELPGANAGFAYVPLTGAARQALRPGKNMLAIHATRPAAVSSSTRNWWTSSSARR